MAWVAVGGETRWVQSEVDSVRDWWHRTSRSRWPAKELVLEVLLGIPLLGYLGQVGIILEIAALATHRRLLEVEFLGTLVEEAIATITITLSISASIAKACARFLVVRCSVVAPSKISRAPRIGLVATSEVVSSTSSSEFVGTIVKWVDVAWLSPLPVPVFILDLV